MGRPAWIACLAAALALPAFAGEPEAGIGPTPWRLEAIELGDGRRLEGLVLAGPAGPPGADAEDVSFLQILRPPGRPMRLIAWPPFAAATVRHVERLPDSAHRELERRVEAFRDGVRRAGETTDVRLARAAEDGPWRYEGPAFVLESTADPKLTREAVVRLEATIEALASLVPPITDAGPFEVRLCGSAAEYRRLQERLGLRIDNPACYLPARRLLAAGSELSALVSQQGAAEDLLDAASQSYTSLDAVLEVRIRDLVADLDAQGVPADRRAEVVRLARLRWNRERGDGAARIETARRENAAIVTRSRRRFDARLAHEAWHAYADGHLKPADAPGLPAWLDEGLAQVVEAAPVEAGEIRLDAPDPDRLVRLQELLRGGGVPPVADILTGGQASFVAGHAGNDQAVAYLVAWGLALDLGIIRPVLSPERIRRLTAAGDEEPLRRFETLVGMPVDQYDRHWRTRMLALRRQAAQPPGPAGP